MIFYLNMFLYLIGIMVIFNMNDFFELRIVSSNHIALIDTKTKRMNIFECNASQIKSIENLNKYFQSMSNNIFNVKKYLSENINEKIKDF